MLFAKKLKFLLTTAFAVSGLAYTSCMNSLDDEDLPESGSVPIEFCVKDGEIGTKVVNDKFEKGDKVGLYATITTADKETTYIENVGMTYGSNNYFIPEKDVYYPEDPDMALQFVCYYPYRQEAVTSGSSKLPVSVRTDQNTAEGYSQSDFLIAYASGKANDAQPVTLNFRHKLAKIKIVLKPNANDELSQIVKDNPRVVAMGFQMAGAYDWKGEGSFLELKEPGSIVPSGEWKANTSSKVVEGKEFIVIPQAVNESQSIQVEWNGNIYNCSLPTNLDTLKSGIEYQMNITAMQANGSFSGTVGKIQEWTTDEDSIGDTENTGGNKALNLHTLSFETSHVYRAYSNGKAVAEICKEYLAGDINSRAIVAYPVNADETTNMDSGIVLQLLDNEEASVGGTLDWNSTANTFIYSGGDKANGSINEIYFTDKGFSLTEANTVAATVSAFTLRDTREGLTEYPIVKIGTQYWMRLNLRATAYRDGTPLKSLTEQGKGPGYFYVSAYNLYFYNGEAINEKEISPQGWKIPTMGDWDKLYAYVGSASLLKEGDWQPTDVDKSVAPVTGLSMLNILPSGIWSQNRHMSSFKAVGYWCVDEVGKVPENTVFFMGESDEIVKDATKTSNQNYYKGLIIRCIKQ